MQVEDEEESKECVKVDDELSKAILAFLDANNRATVEGKVLFTKQIFILTKEIVPNLAKEFEFFPSQFGPYSTELAKRVNRMLEERLIEASKSGRAWAFKITDKGIEILKNIPQSEIDNEEIIQKVAVMKETTQQWGRKKVLNYIYARYPEYGFYARRKEELSDLSY